MKKGAYNLVKQSRFSPEPTSEGAGHHQGRCLRVWVQPALQAVQKCRSQNRRGKRGSVRRSTEEGGGRRGRQVEEEQEGPSQGRRMLSAGGALVKRNCRAGKSGGAGGVRPDQ